jgi:hypothetical protein
MQFLSPFHLRRRRGALLANSPTESASASAISARPNAPTPATSAAKSECPMVAIATKPSTSALLVKATAGLAM